MRKTFLFFVCLILLLISGGTQAFAGESSSGWAWERSDLSPHPKLVFGELPNGFRYALFPNDHPSGRVHLHLLVRSGSRHEAKGQEGLAHFLEHMAFNGSTHFPPGSLIHFFQKIGMNFGGDTNAHTAFDRTVYDIVLPEGKSDTLDQGLRIMADYAGELLFPAEEIERERGIVLAEKRDRNSAAYRMHRAEQGFLFRGTRIPQRPPIGLASVIRSADAKDFRAFYHAWYRPERMLLLGVGDMDLAEVQAKIHAAFGDLKSRGPLLPEPEIGMPDHRGLEFMYHNEPGSGELRLGISTVSSIKPYIHTMQSDKEALLRHMGMRMLSQRLERLKEEGDLSVLSLAAFTHDLFGSIRLADLRMVSRPDSWEENLKIATKTLREALVHGFTAGELERVRQEFIAWFEERAEASQRRESGELAGEFLRDFYTDQVPVCPEAMASLVIPFLEKVELAAVNRSFRQLWSGTHRLVRMLGEGVDLPEGQAKQRMRSIYIAAGDDILKDRLWSESFTFPYLPEPEKVADVKKVWEDEGLGIRDLLLEDGTLLHIRQTDFEAGRVRMRVRLGTGRSGEPWPGLSFIATETLNLSGTGTLGRESLEQALAGKRIALNMGMGPHEIFFDGEARKGDFATLLHLLRARLEDPGFREEAFELARNRHMRELEQAAGSIDRTFSRENPCFFTGGDTRLCPPDAKASELWSLDDIRSWLAPVLASAPLEISVAGDMDMLEVEGLVRSILGKRPLSYGRINEPLAQSPVFTSGLSKTVRVNAHPPASLVQWGFPTGGSSSSLEHRGLNLLAQILRESLREEIRENMGIAYAPFAWYWNYTGWVDWGGIMAGVSVTPEEAEGVSDRILSLAADLGAGGLTPELLERVRGPLINNLKTRQQNNMYWLMGVMDGSGEKPELREWARTLISDYMAWTAEDLSTLAARVLNPEKASLLRVETEK
ncbi:M16 family metallopeptidase [Desulfobotulus mexicanus]|uniref:Insulinase family protein n=1 Tax=Desulfobotulus mexicanus TaxID=2586642 RepID=A0A5Q4VIY2_9BACT|nr:insulinase family protein [Desulfobotulus mexicanus]TYT76202.1 insulinase family protein [Desulfobotulus mexicanus]